jgi:hypothetical protein
MIKNEAEIRIALQAVLVSVLALTGYWGCAAMVLLLLIPWKPIFAVGGYLAQPVVDWRIQKGRERQERGLEQIETELDAILSPPKSPNRAVAPRPQCNPIPPPKLSRVAPVGAFQSFKPQSAAAPAFVKMPESAQDRAATLAIPPAIKHHVRNLPQGVFSNMDLEVEEVKFHGQTAEAYVRFRSSNVSGLVIRQCYLLKRFGDHWEVESRKPANGARKSLPQFQPAIRPELRPT